jgi:hypothetical protein
MIRLLFVGEGERDDTTVPRLVERIVGSAVIEVTKRWSRLHAKGYEKKLEFAVRQAQDAGTVGIVATADEDRSKGGQRCRKLIRARKELRQRSAPFPTALGCPKPHLEAWLLDDEVAVRTAMNLTRSVNPNPKINHVARASATAV